MRGKGRANETKERGKIVMAVIKGVTISSQYAIKYGR